MVLFKPIMAPKINEVHLMCFQEPEIAPFLINGWQFMAPENDNWSEPSACAALGCTEGVVVGLKFLYGLLSIINIRIPINNKKSGTPLPPK